MFSDFSGVAKKVLLLVKFASFLLCGVLDNRLTLYSLSSVVKLSFSNVSDNTVSGVSASV